MRPLLRPSFLALFRSCILRLFSHADAARKRAGRAAAKAAKVTSVKAPTRAAASGADACAGASRQRAATAAAKRKTAAGGK